MGRSPATCVYEECVDRQPVGRGGPGFCAIGRACPTREQRELAAFALALALAIEVWSGRAMCADQMSGLVVISESAVLLRRSRAAPMTMRAVPPCCVRRLPRESS